MVEIADSPAGFFALEASWDIEPNGIAGGVFLNKTIEPRFAARKLRPARTPY